MVGHLYRVYGARCAASIGEVPEEALEEKVHEEKVLEEKALEEKALDQEEADTRYSSLGPFRSTHWFGANGHGQTIV